MFNSKSKAPQHETATNAITTIGSGTTIKGDIISSGDIRIDGLLVGNIISKAKILIGIEGTVEGNIEGQQADILGTIKGKLTIVDLLQLRANANIKGDIYAGKLQMEPSITFNGECHMGANIVEINSTSDKKTAIAVNQS